MSESSAIDRKYKIGGRRRQGRRSVNAARINSRRTSLENSVNSRNRSSNDGLSDLSSIGVSDSDTIGSSQFTSDATEPSKSEEITTNKKDLIRLASNQSTETVKNENIHTIPPEPTIIIENPPEPIKITQNEQTLPKTPEFTQNSPDLHNFTPNLSPKISKKSPKSKSSKKSKVLTRKPAICFSHAASTFSFASLLNENTVDPKNNIQITETPKTNFSTSFQEQDKEDSAIKTITEIEEITETTRRRRNVQEIQFDTQFHDKANLQDLYDAGIVDDDKIDALEGGAITAEELANELKPFLFSGEETIGGIFIEKTGETLTIYDAQRQGYLMRGTALELLEAQAATGKIIDPICRVRLSVDDAFTRGLFDRRYLDTLKRAERAVTGYKTAMGKTLSMFQAMGRGLVTKSRGIRLLEAQIATGGLVDPRVSHRVPINIAFERGLFKKDLYDVLEDPSDDTKGFFDPNTGENLSYLQLINRCQSVDEDGDRIPLRLLHIVEKRLREAPPSPQIGGMNRITSHSSIYSGNSGNSSFYSNQTPPGRNRNNSGFMSPTQGRVMSPVNNMVANNRPMSGMSNSSFSRNVYDSMEQSATRWQAQTTMSQASTTYTQERFTSSNLNEEPNLLSKENTQVTKTKEVRKTVRQDMPHV